MFWIVFGVVAAILLLIFVAVAARDLLQVRFPILRNFPVLGHARYFLTRIGPELRQYIVSRNDEERPFSRDQRHWIYTSADKVNNYFGFGTDNDLEQTPNHLIIKHSAFPLNELHPGENGFDPLYPLPCAKILGGTRGRAKAFRPSSVINISGMSYGSLSRVAVEAINRGCALARCLHNTGEGGIGEHHQHGGELIWQIGTGYFGCRNADGKFDLARFLENVDKNQVRAIEIKLSQGAKPGQGGVLPAAKITPEISRIRGIPMGQDCLSPSSHSAFADVDAMLDFVEMLASESGLPVGIKSAVGQMHFWEDLAARMENTQRMVDFIAIDGGEGGTGAAPLVFSDHVALPFKLGFSRVQQTMARHNLHDKIVFIGSGRLGFPETALFAFGLGCDMINVGREPMLAIGCIQAQKCHDGSCPTGVATQNKWLMRGLVPEDKGPRLANYIVTLRKELTKLSAACGVVHPAMITTDHFEILRADQQMQMLFDSLENSPDSRRPAADDLSEIEKLMRVSEPASISS